MTDDEIIAEVIRTEGDYVNHPNDRGGPTRWGVTINALADYRDHAVTVDDIKKLSVTEAAALYRENYIIKPGFHRIDDGRVRALVVDCAVHHGVRGAIQLLQRALGVSDDGVFGPLTERALHGADMGKLYLSICAFRGRLFGRLITDRPLNAPFAAGWMNRLGKFIEA